MFDVQLPIFDLFDRRKKSNSQTTCLEAGWKKRKEKVEMETSVEIVYFYLQVGQLFSFLKSLSGFIVVFQVVI